MWNNSFTSIKVFFSLLLAICLISCDGDDDLEESISDLPSNLEIETLQFDQHSLDFDKNKTGPYEIKVNSATKEIRFNATNSSEGTELIYHISNSEQTSNAAIPFNSGESVKLELVEGNNLLRVIASDNNRNLSIVYTVNIAKASASAQLSGLAFGELGAESPRTLSPAFSRNIHTYTATLDYEHCSYLVNFTASKPDNQITIDKEIMESNFHAGNLDVGDNFIDIFIASGDVAPVPPPEDSENAEAQSGETKRIREERYTLRVTRSEPTEAQENQNANLRNLSIDGHELNFLCGQYIYSGESSVSVNKQTGFLRISAESEIDGVKMLYKDQDLENNVPMDIELEPDTNVISLSVESLDGSVTNTYQIALNRLDTNQVVVGTVEELQHALLNAKPNDEIRVKPGIYEGPIGVSTSGSDQAAFYSAQSGSRLLPILLTADETADSGDQKPEEKRVTLRIAENDAAGESTSNVLSLSSQYWQVSNLTIEGGDNGVLLDQTNHISLDNLHISGFTHTGVDITGEHNKLLDSTLQQSNTSEAAALVRVRGDSETNSVSANNRISRNQLYVNAATPAILLDVFTEASDIISNDIRSSTSAAVPLITAKGNDTSIRFNYFAPSPSTSSAIAFQQETVAEQSWGNQAKVYNNTLSRRSAELLFIQANSAQEVEASENYLSWLVHDEDEHTSVNYEGGNVTELETGPPDFRISPSESPEDCLALAESETIDDLFFVVLKPCGDSDEFYWNFQFSSNKYVYIKNRSQEDGFLRGVSDFNQRCISPDFASATSLTLLGDNLSGFAQQWAINSDEEAYWFTNKFDQGFALTIGGNTYGTDTPAVVCGFVASERQRFILKP